LASPINSLVPPISSLVPPLKPEVEERGTRKSPDVNLKDFGKKTKSLLLNGASKAKDALPSFDNMQKTIDQLDKKLDVEESFPGLKEIQNDIDKLSGKLDNSGAGKKKSRVWNKLLTQLQGEVKKEAKKKKSQAETTGKPKDETTALLSSESTKEAKSTGAKEKRETTSESKATTASPATTNGAETTAETKETTTSAQTTQEAKTTSEPTKKGEIPHEAEIAPTAEVDTTAESKETTGAPAQMTSQSTTTTPEAETTPESTKKGEMSHEAEIAPDPVFGRIVKFKIEIVFPDEEIDQANSVVSWTQDKIIDRFNTEIEQDFRVRGKIKMVDSTTAEEINFKNSATLTFEGMYADIVGTKRSEFLGECSEALKPCRCIDVYAGSVKVEIVGKKKDVEKAVKSTKANGLKLPSFPALATKSKEKKTTTTKIDLPQNIALTPAPPDTTGETTAASVKTTAAAAETTEEVKETTKEGKPEETTAVSVKTTATAAETTKEVKETTKEGKSTEEVTKTTEEAKETTKMVDVVKIETTEDFDEHLPLKARVEFKTKFKGSSDIFITECTNALRPVKCTDLEKKDGSIEVEFIGPNPEKLAKAMHEISTYGLDLESYGDFPKATILQVPDSVKPLLDSYASTSSAKTTSAQVVDTTIEILKILETTSEPKKEPKQETEKEKGKEQKEEEADNPKKEGKKETKQVIEKEAKEEERSPEAPAKKSESQPEPEAQAENRQFPLIQQKKRHKPKWTVCRDVEDVKTNKGLLSGRTCVQAWDALRRYKEEITECPDLLKTQCPYTCHQCLSRQLLKFDKDFNKIVKDKEEQFLEKCSEVASPVKCIDVKRGSIIVMFEGKSDELKSKIDSFVNKGLQIEGFGQLGEGLKVTPQISGAAPRMPSKAREIIMQAMTHDKKQSVAPKAVVELLLKNKIHVTTIAKALFALGITPADATVALEGAGVDPETVSQALHSLGAPQVPKSLLSDVQKLVLKDTDTVISNLKSKGVELVVLARVLVAIGTDAAVAIKALKNAGYEARNVMIAMDDVAPDDMFSPLKLSEKKTTEKKKPPATTTSVAPSNIWTVSFIFLKIRDCKRGKDAGAIQLAEIQFGDGKNSNGHCNATSLITSPTNSVQDHELSNLCDSRDSKWMDKTMKECGSSLKLSGFEFSKKPTHYRFKTAGDHPARDPEDWEIEVCNGVSCRKAAIHERLSENRLKHSEWLSVELVMISVKVEGLPNGKVLEIMNNHNERKDSLKFDSDGVKQFEYSIVKGNEFNVEIIKTPENLRCTMANGGGVADKDQFVAIYCLPQRNSDFIFGIRVLKTKGCTKPKDHSTDAISFGDIVWLDSKGDSLPYDKLQLNFEPKDLQGNEDLAHTLGENKMFTSVPRKDSGCGGSLLLYGWHFVQHGDSDKASYPLSYRMKTSSKREEWDVSSWEVYRCEGEGAEIAELSEDKKSLEGENCRKAVVEEEIPSQRSKWSSSFSAELFTVSVDMKGWTKDIEVILTNNHDVRGDALTITKGGLSVFSYALTKGSRYGVALKKISDGYACEADGWSGRISADVVVEVTCSQKTAKALETELGSSKLQDSYYAGVFIRVLLFTISFGALVIFLQPRRKPEMQSESIHLLSSY